MERDKVFEEESDEMMRALMLQAKLAELFSNVGAHLVKRGVSVQVLLDDNLQPRRDRIVNDVHLFLELHDGTYFHLKAYTSHMLQVENEMTRGKVFLTGYHQESIHMGGRRHALRQDWYPFDDQQIAEEVIQQNPTLFS